MSYARQMLETYPRDLNVDPGVLAATIDALNDCTQACAADAPACTSTAECAPRPAGAASGPAVSSWPP